jgi:hypothetical protein
MAKRDDSLPRIDRVLSGEQGANLSGDGVRSVHQEVPKKEAAVKPVEALKK